MLNLLVCLINEKCSLFKKQRLEILMAASFISYENTQRSSASQACAQAGVTLSSSKYESFTRRFLNALTAWRENRQKQKSLKKTLSLDPETLRDISGMTAAELSEQMQGTNGRQTGRGVAAHDVLAGMVLAWPSPKKKD
tara:strand:+ start:104 stop:520 length:417 start_codon:yes stop_codon:yes gene_type:complete